MHMTFPLIKIDFSLFPFVLLRWCGWCNNIWWLIIHIELMRWNWCANCNRRHARQRDGCCNLLLHLRIRWICRWDIWCKCYIIVCRCVWLRYKLHLLLLLQKKNETNTCVYNIATTTTTKSNRIFNFCMYHTCGSCEYWAAAPAALGSKTASSPGKLAIDDGGGTFANWLNVGTVNSETIKSNLKFVSKTRPTLVYHLPCVGFVW